MKKERKRRIYVVDKQMQFRMIATFLFSVLTALLVFTVLIFLYYWFTSMSGNNIFKEYITISRQVEMTDKDGNLMRDASGRILTMTEDLPPKNRFDIIIPPILINNLVIMIVMAFVGIFFSHKVAGPVYRIKTDLRQIIEGRKGVRITLRKHDQMKDLADSINQLIEELERERQR